MLGLNRLARNIGNDATRPAMARANTIAIGNDTPRRMVQHAGTGSSAGLNAHRTARVHSKSGYPTERMVRTRTLPSPIQAKQPTFFMPRRGTVKTVDNTNPKYLV